MRKSPAKQERGVACRSNPPAPPQETLKKPALPYVVVALAVALSYLLFGIFWKIGAQPIQYVMVAGVALCALFALWQRRSPDRVMTAIIFAGVVMRIGYMLYTPYNVRQHDVGSLSDSGHITYIYNLFESASLPGTNAYQFYQPPLQHIAEAITVKAFSLFQPGAAPETLLDAAKLVPCFASCALILVSRRVCEAMNVPQRAAVITLAIIAFHPTFYVLAASINNDALALLFFMVSILYTIRWYYRPSMKNILLIALSIGLATMAKLSGATAALFTAPVFLIVLIKMAKAGKAKILIGQFAAFLGVCAPLALWYPIRNLILFHQPLGYVHQIELNSPLFCGGRTVIERFLSFPIGHIFDQLYCKPFGDYNVWLYTLKCSVFGEYSFDKPAVLAAGLTLINLLVILISLAAMIYVTARGKEANGFARYGLFWIWLAQLASFIAFNIKYPFGCTMDFRYIMPTAIVGAMYIGMAFDRIRRKESRAFNLLYAAGCTVVGLFVAASVLFYTV